VASDDELALSFGQDAATYESARPEYPRAAVDWALEPINAAYSTIIDLGAGTGKLTRTLVATGADVLAVEPDAEMATELMAQIPGVETYLGRGEAIPLADASADAITYGQAWHWVDGEQGTAEAARVLRPGGVLALLWNVGDESSPLVARMLEIMGPAPADRYLAGGVRVGAPFEPLEEARFDWSAPITAAGILDSARSRSTFIRAAAEEQARIIRELTEMNAELGLVGDATAEFAYVTRAFRTIRP